MSSTTEATKVQLGQILIDQGVITTRQLEAALAHQKSSGNKLLLGEVLQKMGFCSDEQIMKALACGYDLPFVHLSPRLCDQRIMDVLPKEFLQRQAVLPLFKVRNRLVVAASEPSNVFMVEEIERITGCEVLLVCATSQDIKTTLETNMPASNVFVIDEILDDSYEQSQIEQVQDIGDAKAMAEDSPAIKLVNYLIYHAVREVASDIHIEPDDNSLRIRYRVDGVLYEKMRPPYQMLPAISSRIKIMAGLDISERRLPQDGGIHVMMDGRPVDLRVSTIAGQHGEKIVIRIIDNRNVLLSLEKLGFAYEMLQEWRKLLASPHGMILVTGATGSGKSTTLYSALKELNSAEVNICTVEDPVEFNLPDVNQFQVHEKIGFTFANALRSLLRQDPDIVMIGEIRDGETSRIAVQAALTGHLVLSTLHTNDAPSAVTRLINIGVEPYLVSASVLGVLAQRLVRKICTNCKEPYDPPASMRKVVERLCGEIETFYHGAGCSKCRGSGCTGRIGLYELLVPNDQMRDRIAAIPSITELRNMAADCGMITLRQDGLEKVKAGITTVDEVLFATAF